MKPSLFTFTLLCIAVFDRTSAPCLVDWTMHWCPQVVSWSDGEVDQMNGLSDSLFDAPSIALTLPENGQQGGSLADAGGTPCKFTKTNIPNVLDPNLAIGQGWAWWVGQGRHRSCSSAGIAQSCGTRQNRGLQRGESAHTRVGKKYGG